MAHSVDVVPSATRAAGNLFTVPPGRPFLYCLARAVLDGNLPRSGGTPPSELELGAITILLPTRRAARALQAAFLDASKGRALLLPSIRPIAEADEDGALLTSLSGPSALTPGDTDIPPAIGPIERQLALTSMVERWSKAMRERAAEAGDAAAEALVASAGASTAAQASLLATELGALIDLVETEEVEIARIANIVPDTFSEHWQKTLQFLDIVLQVWPSFLADQGRLSPMDRRNRLVRSEARRLAALPPSTPVIVAGVTGSIPATAELMRVVAGLPNGALVLPGLDQALDDASWQAIAPPRDASTATPQLSSGAPEPPPDHPEHPSHGLKRLLDKLGVERAAVRVLPGAEPDALNAARARLIGEAMRPAATTEQWHAFTRSADHDDIRNALRGVSLIEAADAEEEAEAISLILREVAEHPARTVALVTRDRLLARRVAIRLEAWGIRVDDSAGRPLAKTMPGAFLDLVLQAIGSRFAPVEVMALLKHPLTRLDLPVTAIRRAARTLEIAVFRAPYLGRGLPGILAALDRAEQAERPSRAVGRIWPEDFVTVRELLARLAKAYAPLEALFAGGERHALQALARAHIETGEAIAALPEGDTARGLWAEAAGDAASQFLSGLLDEALPPLDLTAQEYPDFYRSLIARENVRPAVSMHPRIFIWGPFEARLQQPDVVVVGALNEGTWPESVDTGPWLNRPMRAELGLPSPEEKIGYAAHDLAMLLGAPTVHLTRAQKVDGVPAVPSRWLLRLKALLGALELEDAVAPPPERPWLAWAGWRNHVTIRRPAKQPAPCPPLDLRPKKLSVSAVETWMANPYAIFAGHILKLEALPEIGTEPGASLRGSILHAALSAFARLFPAALPANAAAELAALARAELDHLTDDARIAAFWLPRLERFAEWFAETEPARRMDVMKELSEVPGQMVLGTGEPFTLTARADRIDVTPKGLVITDYKTMGLSSLKGLAGEAARGLAPQILLEAAIAMAGGFPGLDTRAIAGLRYISASGAEPPGAEVEIKSKERSPSELARDQQAGLERLIAAFADPAKPYQALRRDRFSYEYDDYAHLARVDEWSGAGGSGEER